MQQLSVHRIPATTRSATISLINNTGDSCLLFRCTVNDAIDIKNSKTVQALRNLRGHFVPGLNGIKFNIQ